MKTLKITLAAIAISLLAAPAFAEAPAREQKRLRQADQIEKLRHSKAKKANKERSTAKKTKKPKKAKKAKMSKASRDELDRPSLADPSLERPLKPRPVAVDDQVAPKAPTVERVGPRPLPVLAKKDAREKEEHKHLRRLAKIQRLAQIARHNGNERLLTQAGTLREKENRRFERALERIQSRSDRKVDAAKPGH